MARRYDPDAYVPLDADVFHFLVAALGEQGVRDVEWAQGIRPPDTPEEFAREVVFVICNSGMKNTVASAIFERCMAALRASSDVREAFGHPGKAVAIATVWRDRRALFEGYLQATDRVAYLAELPWIGETTKWHLAKQFGLDVGKPDVHLQRLAERAGTTAADLCARLAAQTGLRAATVDTILWRACANGVLDSRTGRIPSIGELNVLRDLQDGCRVASSGGSA